MASDSPPEIAERLGNLKYSQKPYQNIYGKLKRRYLRAVSKARKMELLQ